MTRRANRQEPNVAKDVIVGIAQMVAEEITSSPIPTSAISDKVFAGIMCTRLYARILELQMEEGDALIGNDRNLQIQLRRKIEKYRQAQIIWCRVAEGREVQEEIVEYQATNACQSSQDCGTAVCCSASEIGRWTCEDGACQSLKEACPENTSCGGNPAQCLPNATKIQALFYGGKLIPLSQVHNANPDRCDSNHWHPNGGGARALDGSRVADPAPGACGYGKVGEVPVVETYVR